MSLIRRLLNKKEASVNRLVLYRLDQDNLLIRDKRNISGMGTRVHKDHIDALSIKFYQYLSKTGSCHDLQIKNIQLYKLYTRQVKLKLIGVLKCAHRIRNLSLDSEKNIEIVTDKQTASIMKKAFSFLDHEPSNITWKINHSLTSCITINSLIMRFFSLLKMHIAPSSLPKSYFYDHVDSRLPTVLITMPQRRADDFFTAYVEEF